jgi:hypothetical protein
MCLLSKEMVQRAEKGDCPGSRTNETQLVCMCELITSVCFWYQAIQAAEIRRTAETEREARKLLQQSQYRPLAIGVPRPFVRSVAATQLFPRPARKTESASSDSRNSSPLGCEDVTSMEWQAETEQADTAGGAAVVKSEEACGGGLAAAEPTKARSTDLLLEYTQAEEDAAQDWESACEEMRRITRQKETEVRGVTQESVVWASGVYALALTSDSSVCL